MTENNITAMQFLAVILIALGIISLPLCGIVGLTRSKVQGVDGVYFDDSKAAPWILAGVYLLAVLCMTGLGIWTRYEGYL